MKSLGNKVLESKVRKEVEKQQTELAYHLFLQMTPDLVRECEAMFLYVLSLHGYGEKRLHDVHSWFTSICDLPGVFGHQITTKDCKAHISAKYGIDFSETNIKMPTYEEYMEENGLEARPSLHI